MVELLVAWLRKLVGRRERQARQGQERIGVEILRLLAREGTEVGLEGLLLVHQLVVYRKICGVNGERTSGIVQARCVPLR